MIVRLMADKAKNAKDAAVKKPPIETASWCFRDKEEDVHHDFAWTITNFSRKINMVPNGEYIESDKVFSTFAKVKSPSSTNKWSLVFSHCPWHGP